MEEICKKDAEAKLYNVIVMLEFANINSSIKGVNAVLNSINNDNILYYNGLLVQTLYELLDTNNLTITKGSKAEDAYKMYLKNFEVNHSQTKGDVYSGKHRDLSPAAYNTLLDKVK